MRRGRSQRSPRGRPRAAARSRTLAQNVALALGVVYLLAGILGFALTGFEAFASRSDKELLVFGINPLHNIVHIALGVAWLLSASADGAARRVNLVLGGVLVALAVLGFAGLIVDSLLSANLADALLHGATGAVALYFARAGSRPARPGVAP